MAETLYRYWWLCEGCDVRWQSEDPACWACGTESKRKPAPNLNGAHRVNFAETEFISTRLKPSMQLTGESQDVLS